MSGKFIPFVQTGNLVFVSGHIANRDGQPWRGRLGVDLTTEQGQEAAAGVAGDLLDTLREATGNLDRVSRIVKLLVLVNSDPDFTEQSLVANAASEVFLERLGERGAHARSAFGVASLPLGVCVEIELVAELGW